MLLIKDTARRHFTSLPLFIVKFLIPLHSSCFPMKCIFDKIHVLQFLKMQHLISHTVIQRENWEGDRNNYLEAWGCGSF